MMRSERAKFLFGETVRTFRKWRYYGLLLMLSVAFGSVMMLVMLDLFSREMSMVDAQFVQPERIIRYAWCQLIRGIKMLALDDCFPDCSFVVLAPVVGLFGVSH